MRRETRPARRTADPRREDLDDGDSQASSSTVFRGSTTHRIGASDVSKKEWTAGSRATAEREALPKIEQARAGEWALAARRRTLRSQARSASRLLIAAGHGLRATDCSSIENRLESTYSRLSLHPPEDRQPALVQAA